MTTMQPFIPAEELKQKYGIFGHFYSVKLASKEVVHCRSVLEIVSKVRIPADRQAVSGFRPDAVFIMMNPGSSKPLVEVNSCIRVRAIGSLPITLVPTKPDTTQYQVMRLMQLRDWSHVRVLNLSDLRCSRSVEFFTLFERLEDELNFESHSVFSEARTKELSLKIPRSRKTLIVLAWGLSDRLTPLIDRCMTRLPQGKRVIGLLKSGTSNRYRHPLPSLQRDQRKWLEQIVRQFDE